MPATDPTPAGPSAETDPFPPRTTLVLQTSHRITSSISIHEFTVSPSLELNRHLRPTQHLSFQLPEDLDPISGSRNLTDEDRLVTFTPCHLGFDQSGGTVRAVSLITRGGRVAGLLGLPRLQGSLSASLVDIGGGFPPQAWASSASSVICVAGGTGISGFLPLGSVIRPQATQDGHPPVLFWSIRGDDFKLVEYVLENQLLRLSDWCSVKVFVTRGAEDTGLLSGKSDTWWSGQFSSLKQMFGDNLSLISDRMCEVDVVGAMTDNTSNVLFCGSKSLEWQIKMWSMQKATVYCTYR